MLVAGEMAVISILAAIGGVILAVIGRRIYDHLSRPDTERDRIDATYVRGGVHELCRHEWQTTLGGIVTRMETMERLTREDFQRVFSRLDEMSRDLRNGYHSRKSDT